MNNYLEETISLCIAYRNNHDELWYYRIADYDTQDKLLYDIDYKSEVDYGDRIRNALYSLESKIEYKPVLKTWSYESYDSDRVNVLPGVYNGGTVYEITFLENDSNIKNYNEGEVRKKLYDGFYIWPEVNNEFLLVVGAENQEWVALLCKKKNFNIKKDEQGHDVYYFKKNINDLNSDIISFPLYKFSSSEIVSTENLTNYQFMKDIILWDRFFYAKLELPDNKKEFPMRELQELSSALVAKFIRQKQSILGITNNERKKFIEVLNEFVLEDKEIKKYLETINLSDETIKQSIDILVKPILDLYSSQDDLNNLVEDYLLKDNRIAQICIEKVRGEWLLSKNEEKTKIEYEINELLELLESTKEDEMTLNNTILEKEKRIVLFDEEINEKSKIIDAIEKKKDRIEIEIKNQLNCFKNDIVEATKILGIIESRSKQDQLSLSNNVREDETLYIPSKQLYKNECYEKQLLDDLDDFYDYLCENFEGDFDDVGNICSNIISTLLIGKALVIDEYLAQTIADNISMLLSSCTADYFCISTVNVNVSNLVEQINECKSEVIYIDGLLNTYNDNLMISICKNCINKYLIFGVSSENIMMLPKNIWKYGIYINYLEKIKFSKSIIKTISENNKELLHIDRSKYFDETEICKKLLKGKYISKRQYIDFSLYCNILDDIAKGTSKTDLINNICLPLENNNNVDLYNLLIELGISKQQISESLLVIED